MIKAELLNKIDMFFINRRLPRATKVAESSGRRLFFVNTVGLVSDTVKLVDRQKLGLMLEEDRGRPFGERRIRQVMGLDDTKAVNYPGTSVYSNTPRYLDNSALQEDGHK